MCRKGEVIYCVDEEGEAAKGSCMWISCLFSSSLLQSGPAALENNTALNLIFFHSESCLTDL